MTESISSSLRRFNRKERYWVVRNALGEASERLSPAFCERLELALANRNVRVDRDQAWWAIDYHFDWLYAALHIQRHGLDLSHAVPNGETSDRYIKGQQEDIDLIIASGREVILIEAKAFGAWTNSQLLSKLTRLEALGANEDGVMIDTNSASDASPRLHFVVMSRSEPAKLDPKLPWPKWAHDGSKPYWLELDIGLDSPDLSVGRTDGAGKGSRAGTHWAVTRF